jgi:hypothetical protein
MVYQTVVPVPVSAGAGSVTVYARNAPGKSLWSQINGKCIQVGLIPPANTTPTGSFYCYNTVKWVPISGNFTGAYNWNGAAGLVGDITVNILSSTSGVYMVVFIFEDGKPQQ